MGSINILAIDTSYEYSSVALYYQDHFAEIFSHIPNDRSKNLLTMIQQCLPNDEFNFQGLQALTFAAGPGSLTGLKVASSVLQALSIVNNLPIIKISTLQALALAAYEALSYQDKLKCKFIMPCIDAKMHQIYYGLYKVKIVKDATIPIMIYKDSLSSLANIKFLTAGEIHKYIDPKEEILLVGLGDGWLQPQSLPQNIICRMNILDKSINYSAKNIIKIADYLYKNYDIISNAWDAIPYYISPYN